MYKEIVTKAVIGKGKKTFRNKYELTTLDKIDSVLGCWVINHKMSGINDNGSVKITGSFDVNIWYSYENNTKTAVEARTINYTENVVVHLLEEATLNSDSEILLTALKEPQVVDVNTKDNIIYYEIEKELGIEITGDTKVKIQIMNDTTEDYEELEDELTDSDVDKIVDAEIVENYLDNNTLKNKNEL